ncbi:MAG: OmpA family protein [Pseudomonadota bacterium]
MLSAALVAVVPGIASAQTVGTGLWSSDVEFGASAIIPAQVRAQFPFPILPYPDRRPEPPEILPEWLTEEEYALAVEQEQIASAEIVNSEAPPRPTAFANLSIEQFELVGPASPLSSEPLSTEPLSAEPLSLEPVLAEPVSAEPLAAESLAAEPLAAEPLATEPLVAETVSAESLTAERASEEPLSAEPVAVEIASAAPAPSTPPSQAAPLSAAPSPEPASAEPRAPARPSSAPPSSTPLPAARPSPAPRPSAPQPSEPRLSAAPPPALPSSAPTSGPGIDRPLTEPPALSRGLNIGLDLPDGGSGNSPMEDLRVAPEDVALVPRPGESIVQLPNSQGYRLLFEAGSDGLTAAGGSLLEGLAVRMASDPTLWIQIRAFATDTSGLPSNSRSLSLNRALLIRSFLIDRGVRSTRVDIRALGDTAETGPRDRVDLIFSN